MITLLTEYFEARIAEGRLEGKADTLARILMGMMMQLVIANKLWHAESVNQTTVDLLVEVFLNGVRS
jgi:hypothetical protein